MDRFDFDTILYPVTMLHGMLEFWPTGTGSCPEKKMGILALKAMAKGPWPKGADRTRFSKCWYEPFSAKEDARMGLRFTLSILLRRNPSRRGRAVQTGFDTCGQIAAS